MTLLAATLLAGPGCGGEGGGTGVAGTASTKQNTDSTNALAGSICSEAPAFGSLDFEAVGRLPYWSEDMTPTTLGPDGARRMFSHLADISPGFCDAALSPETRAALEEATRLAEQGDKETARALLEALVAEIEGSFDVSSRAGETAILAVMHGRTSSAPMRLIASPARSSTPIPIASGALARKALVMKAVREYLEVAATAQLLGFPPETFPGDPLVKAAETFDEWAVQAVEESRDISELLDIAASSTLLGGDSAVTGRALERAAEIATEQARPLIETFRPCEADIPEAEALLTAVATMALLGGDEDAIGDGMYALQEWIDIQKLRALGQPVPICEGWTLSAEYTKASGNNTGHYTWDGEFTVGDDGVVEGRGTGSVDAHGEADWEGKWTVDCVGTIEFAIEGKQIGEGEAAVFELKLPGTVDYTATYNPPTGPEARETAVDMLLTMARNPHFAGPWSAGVDYVENLPSLPVPVDPGTATFEVPSLGGTLTVTVAQKK